jgi:hypothetical protein
MPRAPLSGSASRMKHLPSTLLRRVRHGRRAGVVGRVLRKALYIKLGVALVLGLLTGLAYLRLSAGPVSFDGLADRVAEAIAVRIGPGWRVDISGSAIELEGGSPALRTMGLDIRNPDGVLVVRAPDAIVSVDATSLLTGSLQPKAIEFRDLQLNASLSKNGTVSFVPVGEAGEGHGSPPPSRPGPVTVPDPAQPSPVSAAIASLFDLVLEPTGIVGALDRARLTNARLRIVDEERRERASFANVNATFERNAAEGRRFDLRLDSPGGGWRLGGEVRFDGEGSREGTLTVTNVPIQDLLLFSGLSAVPASTDMTLTGRLDAAVAKGRVTRFEGRLASSKGVVRIDDEDMPPIDVDGATGEASWDEARRVLSLKDMTFRGGGNLVRMTGALSAPAGQPWRLDLSGADAVLRGVEPTDPTVSINRIDAAVSGRNGRLTVEKLALQGPTVNAVIDTSYGTSTDPKALEVNVFAEATDVRTALRLWPNLIASDVRNYLAAHVRGGTVETLGVSVALSGQELMGAFSKQPIPDRAVRIDFAISDGVFKVAEGLPPLSRIKIHGGITGTKVDVRSDTAVVALADGRALAITDGSFLLPEIWSPRGDAKIAARLHGGADAVAALLQTPLLRDVSGDLNLDPAQIKGQADLRVEIDLPVKNVPKLPDLPMAVAGTVTGVSIEKVFGKDSLENGQLSVNYRGGNLAIRGEGRLAGTQSVIDIRQPRNAAGEASISFALDEAGRARKGISLGPGLTGTLPVRVAVPMGKEAKPGAKVEVDLTKAAIDNLLPGWTKAPGRPGRLTFLVQEGGQELRDIVLESGPVQMRGTAALSADGQVDRADFTTFKLSPGDDVRVQLERAGGVYRAMVRGNLVDARPFIRSFTSPGASGGPREKDVDLDLAVNILSGFNDEALTNATLKAGYRGKDLRQLQLNGRFRSAPVVAQMSRAERGTPYLTLQSRDAGATLRFLDIYRRMVGGDLTFQISMSDGPQRGTVTMTAFALKNEPALRSIVSQQPQAAMAEDRAASARLPQVDPNEVLFNTMRADFIRTASRLEFRDATLLGAQVGFTLGGWIDYARNQTDISGTFVPAYALNNAFAQVPLVGPILGGGRNEGLFAVNFRVAGSASAPTLTVNPLSAVAPGFLRKILGAIEGVGDATGAAPPQRPDR